MPDAGQHFQRSWGCRRRGAAWRRRSRRREPDRHYRRPGTPGPARQDSEPLVGWAGSSARECCRARVATPHAGRPGSETRQTRRDRRGGRNRGSSGGYVNTWAGTRSPASRRASAAEAAIVPPALSPPTTTGKPVGVDGRSSRGPRARRAPRPGTGEPGRGGTRPRRPPIPIEAARAAVTGAQAAAEPCCQEPPCAQTIQPRGFAGRCTRSGTGAPSGCDSTGEHRFRSSPRGHERARSDLAQGAAVDRPLRTRHLPRSR